jgi:hypothetical protein
MLNSILVIEAVKTIYPNIKGGFSYWQTKPDGTPWESDIDGLVWENENYSKPNLEQLNGVIEAFLVKDAKAKKIAEIKAIRDSKNIEPITDHKGFLIDEEGATTAQESYFIFHTNRHQTNPTSDPDSIISRVLDLGAIPYFTKDISGNKITIQLTAELATSLRQRIAERNNNNYRLSSLIEVEINSAQTKEEVEAIDLEA